MKLCIVQMLSVPAQQFVAAFADEIATYEHDALGGFIGARGLNRDIKARRKENRTLVQYLMILDCRTHCPMTEASHEGSLRKDGFLKCNLLWRKRRKLVPDTNRPSRIDH